MSPGPATPAAPGGPLPPGLLPADWPAPPGVRAFSTRRDAPFGRSRPPFERLNLGNARGVAGDDPAAVAANRMALVQAAGLPSAPHWLRQVHGVAVHRAEGPPPPEAPEPEADAAVTARPGVVLAVLHADCLPVLFASRAGDVVGAAHAGWRGLAAGVLEATVAAMGTPPRDLLAWLGPAAGPAAYEVGAEVREAFLEAREAAGRRDATAAAFRPTRPGHWHMDLYALARLRLAALGLTAVSGGGRCTIGEPMAFFSHRREGRTGRMASLVWIDASPSG
ncbi:peptidoglycan editing factor PgeF [Silanimonas lenta]|uniref:peptidoglycan editing factor PgeF n=1 Tax=Silanimonas lenta TaxID=265429 RepID=UPI002FE03451